MTRSGIRLDTAGLSAAGLWVRRQMPVPRLSDEALCLAELVQTWNLEASMSFDAVHSAYAEVSSPDLNPTWVYLIELEGQRTMGGLPLPNHPLSRVKPGTAVRLLALLQPDGFEIAGVLVETPETRRMLWQQAALTPG